MATKRRFELVGYYDRKNHNKFWQAWCEGRTFHAEWGPIGQDARSQKKSFQSPYRATEHMRKKIREKENKGYWEVASVKFETDAERLIRLRDEAVARELEKVGIRQSAEEVKALLRQAGVTPETTNEEFREKVKSIRVDKEKKEPVVVAQEDLEDDGIEINERFQMLEFV